MKLLELLVDFESVSRQLANDYTKEAITITEWRVKHMELLEKYSKKIREAIKQEEHRYV